MTDERQTSEDSEGDEESRRYWTELLEGRNRSLTLGRVLFRWAPGHARCQLCAVPFDGPVAPLARLIGKRPWPKNPRFCDTCFTTLTKNRGGAEIVCSLLFADVRGSTTLAEGMTPTAFRGLMDEFFKIASDALVEHDAIVDKFVGDEAIGIFVPILASSDHAAQAIGAARRLREGLAAREGPPLPVGTGVHTGVAFVGAVGSDSHIDVTAMGDPVNVTARLAAAAGPDEILVSTQAARTAGLDTTGLEQRVLELKGKSQSTSVFVLV